MEAIMSAALKKSLGELLGLARGMLADRELSNSEIEFLQVWLSDHAEVARGFPGNVIQGRIEEVLEDGIITGEERDHLVETLNQLVEGRLEDISGQVDVTELWFDDAGEIDFDRSRFCLTGSFVYGPIRVCSMAIEERGGEVSPTLLEGDFGNPQFLVVGALGVEEWRDGGLGRQIEKAMRLRAAGASVKIIPEDSWASQL
jgi:hypothetical protein